jgi:probable HAF family extracellular repeat protein
MKSRMMCITATTLFAALAVPVRLAAQEKPTTQQAGSTQAGQAQHTPYKLIDLGTFGGPNAVVNGPGERDLSGSGIYVGEAETATPDPYAPNCVDPECLVFHAQKWQNGVVTDLGSLPGVNNSGALGISASGIIVGISQNGSIDPLLGVPENRAVLWTADDRIHDLGTLPGGTESAAISVNSGGQVIGQSNNTVPDPFSGFGTQQRAFLLQNGSMQDIGTLGGPDAFLLLINEQGQITGQSYINAIPNADNGPDQQFCPPGVPTQDPFLWENGTMIDIGSLGGTCSYPFRLNDRGQVTGNSWLAGNQTVHPFFWDRGVLIDIGTFGGSNGTAFDLSDSGEVVGTADFPGDFIHHAFVWKNGVMTDVGVVPGDLCTNGRAINSRGQAIGTSTNCMGVIQHMFLWENGTIFDLSALILPGSDLEVVEAWDMNDRGEIAAVGILPNGDEHAVVLVPASADEVATASPLTQTSHPHVTRVARGKIEDREELGGPRSRLLGAWRARLPQRYHFPGLGTPRD